MKFVRYIIIILTLALVFEACTPKTNSSFSDSSDIEKLNMQIKELNQQIENLEDENQSLNEQLQAVQNENQALQTEQQTILDKQQDMLEILNCFSHMYDCTPISYTQRFIEEDIELRALPDSRLESLKSIKKGTVLEVLAAADIPEGNNLTRWLFVHVYSGDTPSPNLGWIKEADTAAYTLENQKLVTYPLRIKQGTKDIRYNQMISETDLTENYWLDFYEGDRAQLSGSGGRIYVVPIDSIIYPVVDTPED